VWLEVLLVLLVGPVVGSLLGVLILRLPRREPVVFDRSRCDACGRPLRWHDLVPIVSWLARRGRCGCGQARLSWFYPGIELGALGVALWTALILDGWLLLASCVLGWTLLTLALIDLRAFILPDVLTLPLIPAGLGVILLINPDQLQSHLLAAVLGWLAFTGIALAYGYLRGREGLGAGDAKLLTAGGAWVGLQGLPGIVLIAGVSGLTTALLMRLTGRPLSATTSIPFGAHLALGIWLVWLYGPLIIA
jgi:leader peptidase (prepilin peptidase)/N-methyltransferase